MEGAQDDCAEARRGGYRERGRGGEGGRSEWRWERQGQGQGGGQLSTRQDARFAITAHQGDRCVLGVRPTTTTIARGGAPARAPPVTSPRQSWPPTDGARLHRRRRHCAAPRERQWIRRRPWPRRDREGAPRRARTRRHGRRAGRHRRQGAAVAVQGELHFELSADIRR